MKRCYSLKRNKEFRYAYRAGRSVGTKSMVLIYAKGKQDEIKIGFSVSKKLGNAVTRNRIKRRLREAVTPLIPDLKRGYKIVIIAKMPILTDKLPAIASGMRYMARKANLIVQAADEHKPENTCKDSQADGSLRFHGEENGEEVRTDNHDKAGAEE